MVERSAHTQREARRSPRVEVRLSTLRKPLQRLLSHLISLVHREAIKPDRFELVLRQTAKAKFVHPAHIVLRVRFSLTYRKAEQPNSFVLVAWEAATASLVHDAKIILGDCKPLIGGLTEKPNSLAIVLGEATTAFHEHCAKIVQREIIALASS